MLCAASVDSFEACDHSWNLKLCWYECCMVWPVIMMDSIVSVAVGAPGHSYDPCCCSRTCWILRFILTLDIILRYVFWVDTGDHIDIWDPTCHRKLCWCPRCMHVAPAVNHGFISRNHGKRHHFMSKLFMPQVEVAMLSVIIPPIWDNINMSDSNCHWNLYKFSDACFCHMWECSLWEVYS